jgi:RNA polymerase sigma-70 factor (ECF subfamily)
MGGVVQTCVVRALRTPSPASQGPSDAALVVAARAGEAWAQEALFRRYARMVNGLAFRILGRDSDVDDLVQDSFLEALRSLERLDNPQAFASWLGSIVVRTAGKRLRRRSMLNRLGLRRTTPIDADDVISREAAPDVRAELRAIYSCLDSMHHESRLALVLHRVDGMSLPEAAEVVGVSLSTIKRRLQAAERVLAEHTLVEAV